MKPPKYPFVPKSTKSLIPGQFWAVPLSDGTFACGRVIALKSGRYSARAFLAGLLDWHGSKPPTEEDIVGRKTLRQGHAHIKTIVETGGFILGYRALELDGIEPGLFLSQSGAHVNCRLQRGFETLRPATPAEQATLPTLTTWGLQVIRVEAEAKFCSPRNEDK